MLVVFPPRDIHTWGLATRPADCYSPVVSTRYCLEKQEDRDLFVYLLFYHPTRRNTILLGWISLEAFHSPGGHIM
ncbi:hypothetical protein M0804_006252 [Polistes exclamans]|nr:hypothetical protein M0804_006252 [Polistes exclamans]